MCFFNSPPTPQPTPIVSRDDGRVIEQAEQERRKVASRTSFADTILTNTRDQRGPRIARKTLTGE